MSDIARVQCEVPRQMFLRAKKIIKEKGGTVSDIVRAGFIKEIEMHEESLRVYAGSKTKRGITEPLAPLAQPEPVDLTPHAIPDRLAKLFDEQAARLKEVIHDPAAREARAKEAVDVIRRMAPYSYADERKIIARLDLALSTMNLPPPPQLQRQGAPAITVQNLNLAEAVEKLAKIFAPQSPVIAEDDDDMLGRKISPNLLERIKPVSDK